MAVYFIHCGATGAVKIGKSNDVAARLRTLQTASAHGLCLLGSIIGDEAEERAIHRQLRQHRLRGEWFKAVPEVMETIRVILARHTAACTVQGELDRRNNCRAGLSGVRVLIVPTGEKAAIHHTAWNAESRLTLHFEIDGERCGYLASECVLLTDWPVVCRCWCESTEGTEG